MNEADTLSGRRMRGSLDMRAAAATDRADLLAIVAMRFGAVPADVRAWIEACDDLATLERLILVAANVPTWEVFLAELAAGNDEFKLVGGRFEPLSAVPAPAPDVAREHGATDHQPAIHLIPLPRRKEN